MNSFVTKHKRAVITTGGGLSAAAVVWMFATFAPKAWVASNQVQINRHESRISYIEGKLGIHTTTTKGKTNENVQ